MLNNDAEPLLRSGCACRGSAGLAHAGCLVLAAAQCNVDYWTTCPTCKQQFTGEMEVALAHARWQSVRARPLEDPERLFVANNLAVTLLESANDSAGALQLLEEVLQVRRRTLGDEHPETLDSITNLALNYMEVGDYAAAMPLSEEAVALTRRTLGTEREEEAAHAINSLAAVLHLTGDHARARPLYEEALAMRMRRLGPSHLDTMNSAHSLGQCLVGLGQHGLGLSMLEQVNARARRVLGESHPSTVHFLSGEADARADRRDERRGQMQRKRV